ncbi:MAG TPA: hypothetical protein VFM34_10555 [Moraxellaceae bacterium]|nr:hypothetical protein [Moraxellaceae bacterium]
MSLLSYGLSLILIGLAAVAQAEPVQRCIAPDGRQTFTNLACASGERHQSLDVTAAVVDSSGLREWAHRSPPMKNRSSSENVASARYNTRQRDPVACENAQRDYRFEAGNRFARRGMMGVLRDEIRRACGGG